MVVLPTYCLEEGSKPTDDPCKPCVPPSEPAAVPLPPPVGGGTWPTQAGDAFRIWTYYVQLHETDGLPDGGQYLVGYGGTIYTSTITSGFGWAWPPDGKLVPLTGPGWSGVTITLSMEYFGQYAQFSSGISGQYNTPEDAAAVGQAFKTYYYG